MTQIATPGKNNELPCFQIFLRLLENHLPKEDGDVASVSTVLGRDVVRISTSGVVSSISDENVRDDQYVDIK